MKRLWVGAVCGAIAVAFAVPEGIAEGKGGETKVVCISNTGEKEYKETPRHCIFHKRHAPMAEAFFVRTKHDHWKAWKRDHARGRGREQPSMGSTQPVKIRLFHQVRRCGHRVFAKGHFFFPKVGHGSTLKLDTCA
jgi:hypothetical protein